MFSLVSGIYESYWASPQLNLLVVGAQGVGKTTLLERIKVTQFHKKPPPTKLQQDGTSRNNNGSSIDDLLIQAFLTSCTEAKMMDETINNDVQSPRVASTTPLNNNSHADTENHTSATTTNKKRLAWACPAPKRYANAAAVDDDDNDDDVEKPKMPGQEPTEQRTGSMESIDLSRSVETTTGSISTTTGGRGEVQNNNSNNNKEFDVKSGAKMISLHRIRPTIGMNLGKVELCGAKCHFWDLGGRLQDLWERYYLDCDAVVFVWKIDNNSNKDTTAPQDDDDDDDDVIPEITPQLQQGLLEKVRNAIPDDVPFLVLGHVFDNKKNGTTCLPGSLPKSQQQQQHLEMDKLYDTNRLLPHYHNPHQAVCLASAITGQGVRFAMEWLIPLAKRQHRIRDQQQRSLALSTLLQPLDVTAVDNDDNSKDL